MEENKCSNRCCSDCPYFRKMMLQREEELQEMYGEPTINKQFISETSRIQAGIGWLKVLLIPFTITTFILVVKLIVELC